MCVSNRGFRTSKERRMDGCGGHDNAVFLALSLPS
jgi:hypothetical protein